MEMTGEAMNKTSYKVSVYILVFFILVAIFWIIGFSFNFSFLRCKGKRCHGTVGETKGGDGGGSDDGHSDDGNGGSSGSNNCNRNTWADPGRCLVFAIIISLIILLIIWAFVASRR